MTADPTPDEIAEVCRKIRSEWNERELQRRSGFRDGQRLRWTVPGPLRTLLFGTEMNILKAAGFGD